MQLHPGRSSKLSSTLVCGRIASYSPRRVHLGSSAETSVPQLRFNIQMRFHFRPSIDCKGCRESNPLPICTPKIALRYSWHKGKVCRNVSRILVNLFDQRRRSCNAQYDGSACQIHDELQNGWKGGPIHPGRTSKKLEDSPKSTSLTPAEQNSTKRGYTKNFPPDILQIIMNHCIATSVTVECLRALSGVSSFRLHNNGNWTDRCNFRWPSMCPDELVDFPYRICRLLVVLVLRNNVSLAFLFPMRAIRWPNSRS